MFLFGDLFNTKYFPNPFYEIEQYNMCTYTSYKIKSFLENIFIFKREMNDSNFLIQLLENIIVLYFILGLIIKQILQNMTFLR